MQRNLINKSSRFILGVDIAEQPNLELSIKRILERKINVVAGTSFWATNQTKILW